MSLKGKTSLDCIIIIYFQAIHRIHPWLIKILMLHLSMWKLSPQCALSFCNKENALYLFPFFLLFGHVLTLMSIDTIQKWAHGYTDKQTNLISTEIITSIQNTMLFIQHCSCSKPEGCLSSVLKFRSSGSKQITKQTTCPIMTTEFALQRVQKYICYESSIQMQRGRWKTDLSTFAMGLSKMVLDIRLLLILFCLTIFVKSTKKSTNHTSSCWESCLTSLDYLFQIGLKLMEIQHIQLRTYM